MPKLVLKIISRFADLTFTNSAKGGRHLGKPSKIWNSPNHRNFWNVYFLAHPDFKIFPPSPYQSIFIAQISNANVVFDKLQPKNNCKNAFWFKIQPKIMKSKCL